jgi:hypothetical protein
MKAIFELSPLTILSAQDVPDEAIECSAMAMNTLHTLYVDVENKLNEREYNPNSFLFVMHVNNVSRPRRIKASVIYSLPSNRCR